TAGGEEHNHQENLQKARTLALGCKQLLHKAKGTDLLKGPNDPANEKDESHGESQVEIGVGATEQGLVNLEPLWGLMPPSDGPYPGDEPRPIGKENEDENAGEEPKRALNQRPPNDSLQETVQAFDKPFPEILGSFRNLLHTPRSGLSKNDQTQSREPSND